MCNNIDIAFTRIISENGKKVFYFFQINVFTMNTIIHIHHTELR
jgi:hypothetical protein